VTSHVKKIKRYFNKTLNRKKYKHGMRVTDPCIIEHNQNRFIVKDPEKEEQIIKWDDVVEASVCNMYCLIGDLIKIGFVLKDERIVEIDEDMIGWNSIIKKFPDYLYSVTTGIMKASPRI
jgi:hypothetical protein